MGRYHKVCCGLHVAVWKKDAAWPAQIMREILDSLGTIGDFAKLKLYQHMRTKTMDPAFPSGLKQELLKSLEEKTFNYMQGREDWKKLKNRKD